MALQAEIIPFTIPTPAGATTFTINHIRYPGTLAKAYIFVCADNTGTGSEIYGMGLSDGIINISSGIGIADSFGICTARGYSESYCIQTTQAQAFFGGAARMLSGYVNAINIGSVGITLDLNNTPGAQWYAIMIGGDGVSCKVGSYNVGLGSGNVTVGFDVGAVIELAVAGDGVSSGAVFKSGFATQCPNVSDQVGWGVVCNTGALGATYQIADFIQANTTPTAGALSSEVTLAWIANGFSLTFSGTPSGNIGYLAIGGEGVSANLVQIVQPTSTGVQNTTITATDPVIAFFGSTCKTASATASIDTNVMFGAFDGVSQLSQWWGHPSGSVNRDRLSSTTKAITMATANGVSTSTLNAAASCALTSTNIALNWTTVDSTQREVWALVLAQNLTGAPNPCGDNPQASISVLKQTTPIAGGETDFPFGTTGGLSPSTFTLMDGESQIFSGLSPGTYGVTETAPSGWTASYAVSNGDSHSAITVTGTEAITVTVTNTFQSSTPTFRIYRRFALPYDEHYFTYLNRLEIVAQSGVGNGASPNPIIKIRFSKDGGSTFGAFRTMSLGAAAAYTTRAYINRVGRGRDLVAELICDDPVVVAWVQCIVEGEKATGTN